MKHTLLPALAALTLLLTACGETIADGCTTDADCAVGEVCDEPSEQCAPTPAGRCTSVADCEAGQQCDGVTATEAGTCVAPSTSCADQADPDGYCAAQTPDTRCDRAAGACISKAGLCYTTGQCLADQVCYKLESSPDGVGSCVNDDCTTQGPFFCQSVSPDTVCDLKQRRCSAGGANRYIAIRDTSSGAASCQSMTAEGLADAGADLTLIELLNSGGGVVGRARAVAYDQGSGAVDTADLSVFDGTERLTRERACPTDGFSAQTVVSLGCGGTLYVDFLDARGKLVSMESGGEIVIGEYAPFCGDPDASQTGSDTYVVSLCDVPAGQLPDASRCEEVLGAPKGGLSFWRLP